MPQRICLSVVVCVAGSWLAGCGQSLAPSDEGSTGSNEAPATAESGQNDQPQANGGDSEGGFLSAYAGRPVLIVFGDDRTQFISDLGLHSEKMKSQDVLLVQVWDLSQAVKQGQVGGEGLRALTEQETSELADIFGPSPTGLTVVLVGKDGKVIIKKQGNFGPEVILSELPG